VTAADAKPFSMVLPPPNVTGTLHTGSACMLAIEDLVIRYHRMKGERTLWIPGTDHAAIATQSKVEKIIFKKEAKTRHDLGRAELLRRVEAYAKESHDTIVHQTKKLGSSLDWSREAYTLDEQRSFAVRTAFKRMFDDGLIYRGDRIVNWDPNLQTTVSDDEIEWREETIPFYYLQYGPFVISTARPETKFGDKYVVMHPEDARYAAYTDGQKIELEWINGPITATVIKDPVIDREFGTGVMTITPWHDHTDFDIAERHGLDREQIIDENGKLLPIAGEFAGLPIAQARERIVAKLTAKRLIVKTEEQYIHNIAVNSRGEGVIEPQIKRQWFVGVNKEFTRNGRTVTLKTLMREAVSSGRVTILPDRFGKIYHHWIDKLHDWCISRQIWYGHQIPVWYRGEEIYCGIKPPEGEGWGQDPDTLDTWFSSGLWTFSTLGWPTFAETATAGKPGPENDLANYHPTNLLETGYDILFFWVARMILMTEYLLDTHPFETVYLHGLVRATDGRKMSKSLDNIIDPLDVIKTNGADALRLALVAGTTPGNDLKLGDEKIVAMRNFTNKLWNIARYVGTTTAAGSAAHAAKSDADRYLLSRLQTIVCDVSRHLDRYELSLAIEELREFTWGDFADWYVEVHKVEQNDTLLRFAFDFILKLWHPFMPFVTEAIHQTYHFDASPYLMIAPWPSFPDTGAEIADANRFDLVKNLIVDIRAKRALFHIDPTVKMIVSARGGSERTLRDNEEVFKRLARAERIDAAGETIPKNAVVVQAGILHAYLHLEGVVDIAAEKERLGKEISEKKRYADGLTARLADSNFVARAPQEIVAKQKTGMGTALLFGMFAALGSLLAQIALSGVIASESVWFPIVGATIEELLVFTFLFRALSYTGSVLRAFILAGPVFALGFTAAEIATFLYFDRSASPELLPFLFVAIVHILTATLYAIVFRFPSFSLRAIALLGGILIHISYNIAAPSFLR
jgi:valyl-tRNA synthetase